MLWPQGEVRLPPLLLGTLPDARFSKACGCPRHLTRGKHRLAHGARLSARRAADSRTGREIRHRRIRALSARPTPTTEAATLARTLRSSVGCDFPQRLTPDECEACAARTAEGVKTALFIPVPIARTCGPITALAELKVPEKPLARASATNIDIRGVKDSLGGFDCGIPLAPRGCKLRGPPNSLRLGCLPFFIVPPESPLTRDSSLRHPNTLLKSEKQRHHRVLLGLRPALTATRSMTG